MRVLVIGGTLFIGKLLVKRLLAAGHEVTILHRKAEHPFGRRVRNAIADRNDAAIDQKRARRPAVRRRLRYRLRLGARHHRGPGGGDREGDSRAT